MFLSPFFLIFAGIGAAVPLVLHLMQNRKKMQLPFPTLRFLKLAEKHSSRRIRLENILLWLLRTLIMALLGLAFAMPMIRAAGLGWLGEAPRDVALVIDASYSMNYRTGRGVVWDNAIEAARTIIEGLGDKVRFCIYLAREQPEALVAEPIGNKQEGIGRLKTLVPGMGTSRLAPAVTAAVKALRKAETRREREIHIITDNQALPWQSFGVEKGGATPAAGAAATGEAAQWTPEQLDKQTAVFVSLLGVPNPENVAVTSVELQPPVVRKGADIRVTATLSRSGKPADTTATLFIDDKEAGRRALKAGDPASAAPTFMLPPLSAGSHVARIQTPEDNLPIDDTFHFIIRVLDEMPTLVVGSADDTLFIRTALRTGFGRASAITTATPEQVTDKPLSGFACVILCNAIPLPGQAITAIEDYVKAGGLLIIFPGMKATPDAYKAWTCLPGIPSAVEDLPLSQQNRTLTWDKPQHPLVRPLREGLGVPALAIRRRLAWKDVNEATERIVSMGADQPFLLDRPFGDGRVLMFAVAADRTWSDFPLSPFYLPLVLQCVDYGGSTGSKAPFVWATDSLSLSERFPELKGTPTLLAPDGQPVSIRSSVVQARTVMIAENLAAPGIYRMSTAEAPVPMPALAVNIPRSESDLTPIPEADIAKRLGVDDAH
ncbi:MAG: BatA and WFA domain-containing protein, partial [Chthoniobacteraceae bacterium]